MGQSCCSLSNFFYRDASMRTVRENGRIEAQGQEISERERVAGFISIAERSGQLREPLRVFPINLAPRSRINFRPPFKSFHAMRGGCELLLVPRSFEKVQARLTAWEVRDSPAFGVPGSFIARISQHSASENAKPCLLNPRFRSDLTK